MTKPMHLIFLTQKYPFEQGEEFIEKELKYLARHYSFITIIPTLVRDFSAPRTIPPNAQIVKVKNPQGPLAIGLNFIKFAPFFPSLMSIESKSYKLNAFLLKYLAYHIPFAHVIKNEVKKIIDKKSKFALYSYWMDTNAYALHLLVKEKPELQFFLRTHGGDLYNERHPHGQIPFRKPIYQSAGLIAPISENGKVYIGKHWPEYIPKVKTFRLGVEGPGMGPIPTSGPFRIVSCSSTQSVKRLEKISEVISMIQPPIEWIHYGGVENDLVQIRKIAQTIFPKNITFSAPGHISNADLMDFYYKKGCDLFINLSLSEGIPVSIMEAISFGIPIISNDVGGIGEIVNEDTGLMVHVNENPIKIAQKISVFLESGKSRSEAYRQKVRDYWRLNFNAEKNYLGFLEEIQAMTNDYRE